MQNAFGCVGNTIKVRSGRYLDLNDPKPDQFTFDDIASGLSKICRFGGQIPAWYSVAEHSILCATAGMVYGSFAPSTNQALLLHDATEAFIGDVVKPLKIMLPDYAVIEKRLERVIGEKFGIDFESEAERVEIVDRSMLIAERNHWFGQDGVTWPDESGVWPLIVSFYGWNPAEAKRRFVETAAQMRINVKL